MNLSTLHSPTRAGARPSASCWPVMAAVLAVVLLLTGCAHMRAKKLREASEVHYRLGNEYYKAGNLADALKEYTRAIEIYPSEPSYHLMLGFAYSARGLDERAEKEMKESVRLDPSFSEGHIGLASMYMKRGEWDGVIGECRLALKNIYYKTPEVAYLNMGIAHYEKGDYKKSIEDLRRAVALKPDLAVAYYRMGLALERLWKRSEAIDAYRRAVKIRDDYEKAYYRLGYLLVKRGDRAGAVRAFRRVVKLAPESRDARSARDYLDLIE